MQQWQKKLLDDSLMQGPELKLSMAGRRTGKSVWTQQAIDRLTRDFNSRPIEQLVLAQRTYQDTQYYTVAPVGGNWLEMETWCVDTFGDRSKVWDIHLVQIVPYCERGRWYANDRRFWFRNERDRTMFIMKWSS